MTDLSREITVKEQHVMTQFVLNESLAKANRDKRVNDAEEAYKTKCLKLKIKRHADIEKIEAVYQLALKRLTISKQIHTDTAIGKYEDTMRYHTAERDRLLNKGRG